jgi:hypothetical protein
MRQSALPHLTTNAEQARLDADARRAVGWKRWGPCLSERQWATVREDSSEWGASWGYFPHEHARSRAYRWGGRHKTETCAAGTERVIYAVLSRAGCRGRRSPARRRVRHRS